MPQLHCYRVGHRLQIRPRRNALIKERRIHDEDLTATLEYKEEETDPEDVALKVTLTGLRGGHFGIQTGLGHANAYKLMARFMNQVITYDEACLVSWEGGNMRNAIPRECEAVITVPASVLNLFHYSL